MNQEHIIPLSGRLKNASAAEMLNYVVRILAVLTVPAISYSGCIAQDAD